MASYDAAVTQRLGGRHGDVTGSVVGGVGSRALVKALAGCMFGGDAAVRCCHGQGGWWDGQHGGRGSWAGAFEGNAAVRQVVLSGKRGAVQWLM